MAKGDFYFPLFYQRLLTSTIGWTDEEFGAYLRLLIYQFDTGSVPGDIKKLKKISKKAAKNWDFFSQKFVADGKGNFINEVMNEIRGKVNNKKEINKLNGEKGGRPTKPNGSEKITERVTETKAILIDKYIIDKERERSPPDEIEFRIEECLTVAMNDERWVRANKVTVIDLKEFNHLLERRGKYKKNPGDYKEHFANWKASGKKDMNFNEPIEQDFSLKKFK